MERLVLKFAASLRDNVRLEPQQRTNSSSSCCEESRSQRPWICVRVADDFAAQPPPAADARWRSVREKLEAVSVLSAAASCRALSLRANPRFWSHVLTGACGLRDAAPLLAGADRDDDGDDAAPLFLLDFSFMEVTPDLLRLCRTFLSGKRRAKKCLHIRYTKAMSQLEALARQQSTRSLRVRVAFVFHRCELQRPPNALPGAQTGGATQNNAVEQLEEVVAVVATKAATIRRLQSAAAARTRERPGESSSRSRALDADPTVWSSFHFDVVSLEVSASELAKQDFARVERIVADPAGRLRSLVLNKVVSSSRPGVREYAAAFGTLVSRCFGANVGVLVGPGASSEAAEAGDEVTTPCDCALERFVFDWNSLDLCSLSALFSAIRSSSQTSQSAKELSLVGTFRRFDGDAALPWAWLALGVFHATSSSRIRSLDLSSNTLGHDDVNAMRRVLTMNNPHAELLGLEVTYSEQTRATTSESTWSYRAVRLAKRASLWATKSKDGSVLLQLSNESVWLEAFKEGAKWTCVLVPGYGVVWTKTKEILEREDRERQVQRKPSRLTKLMLNSMVGKESEHFSHLLGELMPLIGASLLHLELCSNALNNLTLAAVVDACPNLQHLDVSNCGLTTIGAILDGYERGRCRISSLVLSENEINEQSQTDTDSPIGVGAFGEVYKAKWLSTPVVVKFMGYEADGDEYSREMFMHELRVWYPLNHPHVIKLFGACHVGKRYFVCEFAGNGTLTQYLAREAESSESSESTQPAATHPTLWRKLHEVALGLQYLHAQNVVHNDLKCDNILIGGDGDAKITDFGLSCIPNSAEVQVDQKRQGAQQWKSPEYLRGDRLTAASDVYGFGMCILEAATGRPPWGSVSDVFVRNRVKKGVLPKRPDGLSAPQWSLLEMMCASAPAHRVSVASVAYKLQEFAQQAQHTAEDDEDDGGELDEGGGGEAVEAGAP